MFYKNVLQFVFIFYAQQKKFENLANILQQIKNHKILKIFS